MLLANYIIPKDWVGEIVAIVASGPSVDAFNFDRIAGMKTIAVKDGFLKVPNADVLMIGDHRYARRAPALSTFLGPLILYTDSVPLPQGLRDGRIRFIPKVAGGGLSKQRDRLQGTFTTTALAINLAVLRGSKRILLVGVDGEPGPNGERWFKGSSAPDAKEGWARRYNRQRWGYSRLPRDLEPMGVEVFNLNLNSKVLTFPFLKEGYERG